MFQLKRKKDAVQENKVGLVIQSGKQHQRNDFMKYTDKHDGGETTFCSTSYGNESSTVFAKICGIKDVC